MKSKIILILMLISLRSLEILAATDCTQVTQIPQIECNALIAFYNSTNGPNWSNNTGWNVTNIPCSWYGIYCGVKNVRRLSLSDNQLTGSISAELGNLSNLQLLNLGNNQLTGLIPVELGNLGSLQRFYLDNNQLTGSIPVELGNLGNLQMLNLGDNQLTGSIPVELGNLSNLQRLGLYGNQLTGSIPVELSNLSYLRDLYLSNNRLCGDIPFSLTNLSSLTYLTLKNNGLNVTNLDPELEGFLNSVSTNWKLQDSSVCPASLATLGLFVALPNPNGVLLIWRTLSEYENAGFYIWRGKPIGSTCTSQRSDYYETVEVGFEPTTGDGFSGAPYLYWDDTVEPNTNYCYLLGDVDFSRNITPHWDLITPVTTP